MLAALREVQARGWKLGILSNTDPDLLAASLQRIGIQPDLTITAAEAGSYKPAHEHWERFQEVSGADSDRHVHVAASLVHDIIPCSEMGIRAVWINRKGEVTNYPRAAELTDLSDLPDTLDQLGPKWREFLAGKGQGLKASLNFSQFVGGQSGQNM